MPPQDLIDIPLLALSDDPLAGSPQQTKVHPKHVRRLRDLRLARCLTKERAADLGHFSGLRQLYLDGGVDDPAVLGEIGRGWCGPKPLHVIFGLSIHSPRPIFRQLPALESVTYEIASGTTPSVSDAHTARFSLGPSQALPSVLSTWAKLTQLHVDLEGSGEIRLAPSPMLSFLTVNLCEIGTLDAQGQPLAFEPLSLRLKPRLLRSPEIETKGDMRVFTALSMNVDGRNDPVSTVKQFPGLKNVRLTFTPPKARSEIEDLVNRIATADCVVTASQSVGTFLSEEYASGTKTWNEHSDR